MSRMRPFIILFITLQEVKEPQHWMTPETSDIKWHLMMYLPPFHTGGGIGKYYTET